MIVIEIADMRIIPKVMITIAIKEISVNEEMIPTKVMILKGETINHYRRNDRDRNLDDMRDDRYKEERSWCNGTSVCSSIRKTYSDTCKKWKGDTNIWLG